MTAPFPTHRSYRSIAFLAFLCLTFLPAAPAPVRQAKPGIPAPESKPAAEPLAPHRHRALPRGWVLFDDCHRSANILSTLTKANTARLLFEDFCPTDDMETPSPDGKDAEPPSGRYQLAWSVRRRPDLTAENWGVIRETVYQEDDYGKAVSNAFVDMRTGKIAVVIPHHWLRQVDRKSGKVITRSCAGNACPQLGHCDLRAFWTQDERTAVFIQDGKWGYREIYLLNRVGRRFVVTPIGERVERAIARRYSHVRPSEYRKIQRQFYSESGLPYEGEGMEFYVRPDGGRWRIRLDARRLTLCAGVNMANLEEYEGTSGTVRLRFGRDRRGTVHVAVASVRDD